MFKLVLDSFVIQLTVFGTVVNKQTPRNIDGRELTEKVPGRI